MIIDIHTHIPQERKHWPGYLDTLSACGIDHSVALSIAGMQEYPDTGSVRASNDLYRDFAVASGGRASWFLFVNPQLDGIAQEIRRGKTNGARGVKLWISCKGEKGGIETCHPVLAEAEAIGLPVLIHTYDRCVPRYPGEINLQEFVMLAERFPAVPMVAAHAGADWRTAVGVLRRRAPNAYVDISGHFPAYGMVETLVADLGADRVLFGSDAFGRTAASQLAKVTLADISETDREKILWRNAHRLLGGDLPLCTSAVACDGISNGKIEMPDPGEDHFCFCGDWPFFPSRCAGPKQLGRTLADAGVKHAYTADLGSIYRRDLEAANAAFLEAARGRDRIAPLAVINPTNQNWRQVLAAAQPGFPGGIVLPALHAWQLDAADYAEFFARCADAHWPLWINADLDDPRFRHSGVTVRPVATTELVGFVHTAPANDYVLQGLHAPGVRAALDARGERGRFRFEISRISDSGGPEGPHLPGMFADYGRKAFVHGSEFPLRHILQVRQTTELLCK